MDIEQGLELLIRMIMHGAIPDVAGVIDDNINRPEGIQRCLNQLVWKIRICDASRDRQATHCLRGLRSYVSIQVVNDNLSTFTGQ